MFTLLPFYFVVFLQLSLRPLHGQQPYHCRVLREPGIKFNQIQINQKLDNIGIICQTKTRATLFDIGADQGPLHPFENFPGRQIGLVLVVLEHRAVEEEPDAVSEEEICLTPLQNERQQVFGIIQCSFQVKRAELRNKELHVIPKWRREVGIDPTLRL